MAGRYDNAPMRSIENTLALWVSGLLSADHVVEWAGREVARVPEPPDDLFELLSCGPEQCLKRATADFSPRPSALGYVQEFAIRALGLSLTSNESVLRFADCASRRCMGQDLSDRFVALGYRLDHLLFDCQDKEGAKALVRDEVPSLLPAWRTVAAPFLDAGGPPL
jgi:hypothetical protein